MRKICCHLIYLFSIALFSTSAFAQDGICDALQADGVTKGLYGLCIAYHASGANSQAILDNYNKKKTSSDPVMPGTDDNPPTLGCACWNTLTAEDIGTNSELLPSACSLSPEIDLIEYKSSDTENPANVLTEFLLAAAGFCLYANSVTGDDIAISGLSSEQEDECRLEILDLAIRDFQAFNCLP